MIMIKLANIVVFYIVYLMHSINSTELPDPIVWSIYNQMFKPATSTTTDQKEPQHVINVRIGEFLNIICPKYTIDDSDTKFVEYHTLYMVSKQSYDKCELNSDSKQILRCDKPYENLKFTLYISQFNPVPNAIEFEPGNSYYFISTSNSTFNGMNNTIGGTCSTNNMKIIVKVLEPDNNLEQEEQTTHKSSSSSSLLKYTTSKSSSNQPTLSSTLTIPLIATTTKSLLNMLMTNAINPIKDRFNFSPSSSSSNRRKTVTTANDIIIIQPDNEYFDLLSIYLTTTTSTKRHRIKPDRHQMASSQHQASVSSSSLLTSLLNKTDASNLLSYFQSSSTNNCQSVYKSSTYSLFLTTTTTTTFISLLLLITIK